jgi:hypothetical protein
VGLGSLFWLISVFEGPSEVSKRRHSSPNLRAHADAGRAEVDVLDVAFVLEPGRQQPNDMHACLAAVVRQLLNQWVFSHFLRHVFEEIRDDVPQLMRLPLASDVTGDPARILDVLVTMQDLPNGLWLRPCRVPREDDRALPRKGPEAAQKQDKEEGLLTHIVNVYRLIIKELRSIRADPICANKCPLSGVKRT